MANPDLRGLWRAEFQAAERLYQRSLLCQAAVGAFAVAAVFVPGVKAAFTFTAASLVATIAWYAMSIESGRKKSAADKGRRATTLSDAFGKSLTGRQEADLRESLASTEAQAQAWADENYYATTAEPGAGRLLGATIESAFYSRLLYARCAKRLTLYFAAWILVGIAALFGSPFLAAGDGQVQLAQAVAVVFLLLVGLDLGGRAVAYRSASEELRALDAALEHLECENPGIVDVMAAFSDYNTVVATAPIIPTSTYEKNKAEIEKLWEVRTHPSR